MHAGTHAEGGNMELFTHVQELGGLLKFGFSLFVLLVVGSLLFTIPGVRAFVSHLFKEILVEQVLKTFWGKRIATAIVCFLALGGIVWTGFWMFDGITKEAQALSTQHEVTALQERYAVLHTQVTAYQKAHQPEPADDTGKAGVLAKVTRWKSNDKQKEGHPCTSATFEIISGEPIVAQAEVDNRDNTSGVLVVVHNSTDSEHLYDEKPMLFHVREDVLESGDTTWLLERDTMTRRGFDTDEAYTFTANKAVVALLQGDCAP